MKCKKWNPTTEPYTLPGGRTRYCSKLTRYDIENATLLWRALLSDPWQIPEHLDAREGFIPLLYGPVRYIPLYEQILLFKTNTVKINSKQKQDGILCSVPINSTLNKDHLEMALRRLSPQAIIKFVELLEKKHEKVLQNNVNNEENKQSEISNNEEKYNLNYKDIKPDLNSELSSLKGISTQLYIKNLENNKINSVQNYIQKDISNIKETYNRCKKISLINNTKESWYPIKQKNLIINKQDTLNFDNDFSISHLSEKKYLRKSQDSSIINEISDLLFKYFNDSIPVPIQCLQLSRLKKKILHQTSYPEENFKEVIKYSPLEIIDIVGSLANQLHYLSSNHTKLRVLNKCISIEELLKQETLNYESIDLKESLSIINSLNSLRKNYYYAPGVWPKYAIKTDTVSESFLSYSKLPEDINIRDIQILSDKYDSKQNYSIDFWPNSLSIELDSNDLQNWSYCKYELSLGDSNISCINSGTNSINTYLTCPSPIRTVDCGEIVNGILTVILVCSVSRNPVYSPGCLDLVTIMNIPVSDLTCSSENISEIEKNIDHISKVNDDNIVFCEQGTLNIPSNKFNSENYFDERSDYGKNKYTNKVSLLNDSESLIDEIKKSNIKTNKRIKHINIQDFNSIDTNIMVFSSGSPRKRKTSASQKYNKEKRNQFFNKNYLDNNLKTISYKNIEDSFDYNIDNLKIPQILPIVSDNCVKYNTFNSNIKNQYSQTKSNSINKEVMKNSLSEFSGIQSKNISEENEAYYFNNLMSPKTKDLHNEIVKITKETDDYGFYDIAMKKYFNLDNSKKKQDLSTFRDSLKHYKQKQKNSVTMPVISSNDINRKYHSDSDHQGILDLNKYENTYSLISKSEIDLKNIPDSDSILSTNNSSDSASASSNIHSEIREISLIRKEQHRSQQCKTSCPSQLSIINCDWYAIPSTIEIKILVVSGNAILVVLTCTEGLLTYNILNKKLIPRTRTTFSYRPLCMTAVREHSSVVIGGLGGKISIICLITGNIKKEISLKLHSYAVDLNEYNEIEKQANNYNKQQSSVSAIWEDSSDEDNENTINYETEVISDKDEFIIERILYDQAIPTGGPWKLAVKNIVVLDISNCINQIAVSLANGTLLIASFDQDGLVESVQKRNKESCCIAPGLIHHTLVIGDDRIRMNNLISGLSYTGAVLYVPVASNDLVTSIIDVDGVILATWLSGSVTLHDQFLPFRASHVCWTWSAIQYPILGISEDLYQHKTINQLCNISTEKASGSQNNEIQEKNVSTNILSDINSQTEKNKINHTRDLSFNSSPEQKENLTPEYCNFDIQKNSKICKSTPETSTFMSSIYSGKSSGRKIGFTEKRSHYNDQPIDYFPISESINRKIKSLETLADNSLQGSISITQSHSIANNTEHYLSAINCYVTSVSCERGIPLTNENTSAQKKLIFTSESSDVHDFGNQSKNNTLCSKSYKQYKKKSLNTSYEKKTNVVFAHENKLLNNNDKSEDDKSKHYTIADPIEQWADNTQRIRRPYIRGMRVKSNKPTRGFSDIRTTYGTVAEEFPRAITVSSLGHIRIQGLPLAWYITGNGILHIFDISPYAPRLRHSSKIPSDACI